MIRKNTILLIVCVLLFQLAIPSLIEVEAAEEMKSYVVVLRDAEYDRFVEKHQLVKKNVKRIGKTNSLTVSLERSELDSIRRDEQVVVVEENASVQAASIGTVNSDHNLIKNMKKEAQVLPDGTKDIGVSYATDAKLDGKQIKIALLDTGIAEHSDLKVKGGVSFVQGVNTYADDNGHGTHVAGTIAALNNKFGIVGAASGADLYAVKVLDDKGGGSYAGIIEGIEWAIENKMNVISMSFGGKMNSEALHAVIKKAYEQGILIIAAAGNNGLGDETELIPAQYQEVISVGAVDQDYRRAVFSSTGAQLDLVAPGVDILSTSNDGVYGVMTGTSMATPHVTGAAAVLWSQHPEWTAEQVQRKLLETSTPLGDSHLYGRGFVNLARALGLTEQDLIKPLQESPIPENPTMQVSDEQSDNRFDIDEYDKRFAQLGNQLLDLADQAIANENWELAKEIQQQYNDLLIQNNQLHQLPIDAESALSKTDAHKQELFLSLHYSGKEQEFAKLETEYRKRIATSTVRLQQYKQDTDTMSMVTLPPKQLTSPDIQIASYEKMGDNQTRTAGNVANLTLKLYSPKNRVDITVYKESNPTNIVTSETRFNLPADTAIDFKWEIPITLEPGVYKIRYSYPENGTTAYDDTFTCTVTTPASGNFDSFEPNNKMEEAYSVYPGKTYTSYISSDKDYDYYILKPEKSGYIRISLSEPSDKEYYFDVKDENGLSIRLTGGSEYDFNVYVGKKYYIPVYGVLGDNGDLPYHLEFSTVEAELPPAPSGLQSSVTDSTLTMKWNGVNFARSYGIKLNGNFRVTMSASRTHYTFTGLSNNTPYSWEVASQNWRGTGPYNAQTVTTQTTSQQVMLLDVPFDLDKTAGQSQVYKLTTTTSGTYKIYTSSYGESGTTNDTVLELYNDPALTDRVDYNDDANGTLFSEIKPTLTAGTTYFLKVRNYNTTTALHARVQAVIAPAVPTAVADGGTYDFTFDAYGNKVFVIRPTQTAEYAIATDYYGGTNSYGSSDTLLQLFSDMNLTNQLAYNDDASGTFSRLSTVLTAGNTYYIKVAGYNNQSGKARLKVTTTPINFVSLTPSSPIDLSQSNGNASYLKLIPTKNGTYEFKTSEYNGTTTANDTVIEVYANAALTQKIAENDDFNATSKFSRIVYDLEAGTTYYVKVREYLGGTLSARFGATFLYEKIDLYIGRNGDEPTYIDQSHVRVYPSGITYVQVNQPDSKLLSYQEGIDYFKEDGLYWFTTTSMNQGMTVTQDATKVTIDITDSEVNRLLDIQPAPQPGSADATVSYIGGSCTTNCDYTVFLAAGINTKHCVYASDDCSLLDALIDLPGIVYPNKKVKIVDLYPYGSLNGLDNAKAEDWMYVAFVIGQMRKVAQDMTLSPNFSEGGMYLVDTVNAQYQSGKLVLIGHSGGGIASYTGAQVLEKQYGRTVHQIVQVGSPIMDLSSMFYPNLAHKTNFINGNFWGSDPVPFLGLMRDPSLSLSSTWVIDHFGPVAPRNVVHIPIGSQSTSTDSLQIGFSVHTGYFVNSLWTDRNGISHNNLNTTLWTLKSWVQ